MVRATCGVPATVTGSSKETVTEMASPAMKTPFAPIPVPESARPVTRGPTASVPPPVTLKFASSASAWVPRPRAASLFAPSLIVPLFRVSAEAPTATPFASVSPEATV